MVPATIARVGRRGWVGALVLLVGVSCGGGRGGSPSVSPSALPPAAGEARVEAHARGCHTTRTGEVDIQASFDLPQRSALAGYPGALEFHADLVRPTSWTTVSAAPHLIDRPNSEIFHLVVPEGEPIPETLELHVRAVALAASATASSPSAAGLAGSTLQTPFGELVVGPVDDAGGSLTVRIPPPADGLGAGVTSLGPASADLRVGGGSVTGTVASGIDGAIVRFDLGTPPSGPTTLTLGSWAFDLQPDVELPVPVGVCTAG
jgi:hypothetical protein